MTIYRKKKDKKIIPKVKKKWVIVNAKTQIYVDAKIPDEVAIKRFLEKLENFQKYEASKDYKLRTANKKFKESS